MSRFARATRNCALLCCALLGSVGPQAIAQPAELSNPDWYQVELIIFRYEDPSAALTETWPLLPDLAYPEELHFLRADAPPNDLERSFEFYRVEELTSAEFATGQEAEMPLAEGASARALAAATGDAPIDFSLPSAFVLLDQELREYNSERRRLNRTNARQVLFHQSWLQPMKSRANSLAIHIASERPAKGDYPVLQGSLLLYVARYLHVETNLWLNTEGENLEANWSMPPPPLPPQPIDVAVQSLRVNLAANFAAREEPAIATGALLTGAPVLDAMPGPPLADYPFAHAVLLQQKRRMRSEELHYIDHPRLGLLIKFKPYEFRPFTEPGTLPAPRQ